MASMSAISLHDDQRALIELLHSRGQRVTPQRLVILRELRRRGRHATAEEIYRSVREDLPGTSIPTVYATLELFVDLGVARKIDAGLPGALFDARTEPHQHMVCQQCGRIEDLDGDLDTNSLVQAAGDQGFRVDRAELVIFGVCSHCAA
jgi:Fe2+ or Zn2+ uptake regulation protein